MIYHELAYFYDLLVQDEEATQKWVEYTKDYCQSGDILELACGSGEITRSLNHLSYRVWASDLSQDMIEVAKKKPGSELITFFQADMTNFEIDHQFDCILCYCDSVNYLENEEQFIKMIQCVKKHLKQGGFFLFDTHSLDRLEEFKEEYIEEGILEDTMYQWTIISDENHIHHHFSFWKKEGLEQEFHVQTVFEPSWIEKVLQENGFSCQWKTDFDKDGIVEGEKLFVACKKVEE